MEYALPTKFRQPRATPTFSSVGLVYDNADIARHVRWLHDYWNSRWRPQLPVSVAGILNFGSRPTSDNVGSTTSESGMIANRVIRLQLESSPRACDSSFYINRLMARYQLLSFVKILHLPLTSYVHIRFAADATNVEQIDSVISKSQAES